jgi:hypothetical protein
MNRLRPRLTYANVMSTIAVFAVLGGGAYAASKIGPKDIRKGAVRSKAIKKNAVTAEKIAGGVLGGPAPPNGPAGGDLAGSYPNPDLADGAVRAAELGQGSVNAQKLAPIVDAMDTESIPDNGMDTVTAVCPAGTRVLSGGGTTSSFGMTLSTSQRAPSGEAWTVAARNQTGSAQDLTAFAYCLDGPN